MANNLVKLLNLFVTTVPDLFNEKLRKVIQQENKIKIEQFFSQNNVGFPKSYTKNFTLDLKLLKILKGENIYSERLKSLYVATLLRAYFIHDDISDQDLDKMQRNCAKLLEGIFSITEILSEITAAKCNNRNFDSLKDKLRNMFFDDSEMSIFLAKEILNQVNIKENQEIYNELSTLVSKSENVTKELFGVLKKSKSTLQKHSTIRKLFECAVNNCEQVFDLNKLKSSDQQVASSLIQIERSVSQNSQDSNPEASIFTQKNISFFRLFLILIDKGGEAAKRVFSNYLSGNNLSIDTFFLNNKTKIENCKYFTHDEKEILYPNGVPVDKLENFDLTLTIKVIQNLTKIRPVDGWNTDKDTNYKSKGCCLKKLRILRNERLHVANKNQIEITSEQLKRMNEYPPNSNYCDLSLLAKIEWCISNLVDIEWSDYETDITRYLNDDIIQKVNRIRANKTWEHQFDYIELFKYYDLASINATLGNIQRSNKLQYNELKSGQNLLNKKVDKILENEPTKLLEKIPDFIEIKFDDIKDFLEPGNKVLYFKILVLCVDFDDMENKSEFALAASSVDWNLVIDLDTSSRCSNGLCDIIRQKHTDRARPLKVVNLVNYMNNMTALVQDFNLKQMQNNEETFYVLPNGCKFTDNDGVSAIEDFYLNIYLFFNSAIQNIDYKDIVIVNLFLKQINREVENMNKITMSVMISKACEKALNNTNQVFNILNLIPSDNNQINKLAVAKEFSKPSDRIKLMANYIQLNSLSKALQSLKTSDQQEGQKIFLPSESGKWEFKDFVNYQACIEVYFLGIGKLKDQSYDEKMKTAINYLNGNKITPNAIYLNEEDNFQTFVKRDEMKNLHEYVENKAKLIVNHYKQNLFVVNYEPSAGATTLGHYLLFKMHKNYPCVAVKSIDNKYLIEGLSLITQETQKTMIILIDDNTNKEQITYDDVFRLRSMLENKRVKACIVFLQKDLNAGQSQNQMNVENKRVKLSTEIASESEQNSFKELYKKFSSNKVEQYKRVYLYGLYAFEKDYYPTIEKMVVSNLELLKKEIHGKRLKDILYLMAFTHVYSDRKFLINHIALFLKKEPNDFLKSLISETEPAILSFFTIDKKKDDGLLPFHRVVSDYLIKILGEQDEDEEPEQEQEQENRKNLDPQLKIKSHQIHKFYRLLFELVQLVIKSKNKFYKFELMELLTQMFINFKSDRMEHFAIIIRDTQQFLGNEITEKFLKNLAELSKELDTSTNELVGNQTDHNPIYPFLMSIHARFIFYEMNDQKTGIIMMKNYFFPSSSISHVLHEDFQLKNHLRNHFFSTFKFADLFTTYGNMLRKCVCSIIYGKNFSSEVEKNLDNLIYLGEESIEAFEMARNIQFKTNENQNQNKNSKFKKLNSVQPYIGECKIRYELLKYFFENECKKKQETFTRKISELVNTKKLLKESETRITILLDELKGIVTIDPIEPDNDVFNLKFRILKFRLDIDNGPSIETILKRIPVESQQLNIEVMLHYTQGKKLQNLSKGHLKLIIDRLEEQILQNKKIYSNYEALIKAYLCAQNFRNLEKIYNFEKALKYCNEWKGWFEEMYDPYFYNGMFLLAKGIQNNDKNDITSGMKDLKICRNVCNALNPKSYRDLSYVLTSQKGLGALKRAERDSEAHLEVFFGIIEKKEKFYYSKVKKIEQSGTEINFYNEIIANYTPHLSDGLNNIPKAELDSQKRFQFNLVIRRDNIYIKDAKLLIEQTF